MFASWSAGDFGAVGATEWLEVRLTTGVFSLVSSVFYIIST